MKTIPRTILTLGSAIVLATAGCATQQVRTARALETIDTAPAQTDKGYVDFFSVSKDTLVVPVFLMDEHHQPQLLAATGLRQGDRYCFRTHGTTAAETLRVAVPAGRHEFMVEKDGQILQVPVEAGKVTAVQIDYGLIWRATTVRVYNPSFRLFQPVALKDERRRS